MDDEKDQVINLRKPPRKHQREAKVENWTRKTAVVLERETRGSREAVAKEMMRSRSQG